MNPDTRCCVVPAGGTDATSYVCAVDGSPCEVIALVEPLVRAVIADDEERGAALEATLPFLPCSSCRVAEAGAKRLAGVKLGRRERRILLDAARAAEGPRDRPGTPVVIVTDQPERAAREANRRAVRTLVGRGLIETGRNTAGPRIRRGVRLSPLGGAAVRLLRPDLESGRPIRWERHVAEIVALARRDMDWLRERFARTIESAVSFDTLVGAVAGRRGDGDSVEPLPQRAALLGSVLRALATPAPEPTCRRCGQARDPRALEPDGPSLCGQCWAELGRAWLERHPADSSPPMVPPLAPRPADRQSRSEGAA